MAEIKTRIALKYDSLTNWQSSVFNGTDPSKWLKAGEVAIVTLGSDVESTHPTNASNQHPLLFKVGTGTHKFDDLAWASALAADVYDWAKAADIVFENEHIIFKAANGSTIKDLDLSIFALDADLGNVTALTTTAKTAVGAINEHDAEIGDLSKLNTTNKGNLVAAVNEALQAVEVGGTGSVVTVTKQATPTDGSEATYVVNQGGKAVDVKIEIPKYDTSADYGVLEVKGDAASGVEIDNTDAQRPIVKIKAETYDAHGAANDIKTGIENGTIKAKAAEHADTAGHADAAGKVDNALTVKVGGADVVFDGSAAKTADVDAAIAAAIDAIPEVVHPEYSIVKDATSEYAATYHLTKDGVNVGAAINIPKDLVVESGKVETLEAGVWGEAGTYIILTLANATNDKIYVRVDSLIEYVTSGSTADSQVIVAIDENHKVTATIGAGKVGMTELADEVKTAIAKDDNTTYGFAKKTGTDLTFTVTPSEGSAYDVTVEAGALAIKDTIATSDIDNKAVTEEKLADAVTAKLNKEWQPVGNYQPAGDYKVIQTVVENKITDAAHVLTSLTQNENGVVSYGVKKLTPADIGAQPAGDYATRDEVASQNAVVLAEAQEYADNRYTAAPNGGLKLNEDKSFAIDDSMIFMFNCGTATTVID